MLDGTRTVKTWFVSGALSGSIRKIETTVGSKILTKYQAVYDEKGKLIRSYDANKMPTEYVYDEKGRRISEIRDGKSVWNRLYLGDEDSYETTTPFGEKKIRLKKTNPEYSRLLSKLPEDQRVKLPVAEFFEKTTVNGKSRQVFYSASGKTLAEINARNELITFVYDGSGNLVKSLRNGQLWIENSYDLNGKLSSRKEFDGNLKKVFVQVLEYDSTGAVTKVVNTNLVNKTSGVLENGVTTIVINNIKGVENENQK